MKCKLLAGFLVAGLAAGQDDLVWPNPGIVLPTVLRRAEPEFPEAARELGAQGSVLLELVVDTQGLPKGITLLRPMGFGLDESAVQAISRWRFAPATQAGKPVNLITTVEVSFQLLGSQSTRDSELKQSFDLASRTVIRSGATEAEISEAVRNVQDLAKKGYPPALHLVGTWHLRGAHVAKDLEAGLELMAKAARNNYAPAMYEVALRRLEPNPPPKELQKGLEMMRQAALGGHLAAQAHMGQRYEIGHGVQVDLGQAQQYFRRCAAKGEASCQFRLAKLMLDSPGRQQREFVQAIAWLQLASERGSNDAKMLAAQEMPKLTADQAEFVGKLKPQLVGLPRR